MELYRVAEAIPMVIIIVGIVNFANLILRPLRYIDQLKPKLIFVFTWEDSDETIRLVGNLICVHSTLMTVSLP
jgi:hypothetical protein